MAIFPRYARNYSVVSDKYRKYRPMNSFRTLFVSNSEPRVTISEKITKWIHQTFSLN